MDCSMKRKIKIDLTLLLMCVLFSCGWTYVIIAIISLFDR